MKFTNAGRRVVEDTLGMEEGQIQEALGAYGPGTRIRTALFFGATRKFHARDFPSLAHVDNFMDEFVDARDDLAEENAPAAEDLEWEMLASLLAAYSRQDKKFLLRAIKGELDPNGSGDEDPKGKAKASPGKDKETASG